MADKKKSILAVIPARGGSKGIPGKNLYPFANRPLIAWTIDAAMQANCVDRIVVSTDDPEIADTSRDLGADAPFLRPPELATDNAGSLDVLRHSIMACPGYDLVVFLQPTSPLRSAHDIDAAYELMQERSATVCVSVTSVDQSPWLMYAMGTENRISPILPPLEGVTRRQDYPAIYKLNGAIYFWNTIAFLKSRKMVTEESVGYVMPTERSIDIDTLEDVVQGEAYLRVGDAEIAKLNVR